MLIGKRIRELRKKKNMTLVELSEKSGVALATLSRMENNKMYGTVASHNKICKALGVSISTLYRALEDEAKTIDSVSEEKRVERFVSADKSKYELLVTNMLEKKMMPFLVKIEPGGQTQEEINNPGIEKFIYVMSGVFEAFIGKHNYVLRKGDSIYFDASLSHYLKNNTDRASEAVCVLSPPEI